MELGALPPRVGGPVPGPASAALARRLRSVESRNVTWLGEDFPVFWEEARGANVRDADGNVYVDLTGAFGVAFAGHGDEAVARAVERQVSRLVHGMGDVHPPAAKVRFLERLAAFSPWEDARSVAASTGSESVEVALKTAHLATGRPGVLAFEGGYHGLTLGALSVTHRPAFREPFRPRVFEGVAWAPFAVREDEVDPALDVVEGVLARGARGHPVGAVVVEPVQGRAGVRIPAQGFLEGVAERARAAGALLVLDEVFTGCGRTGRRFAFEHDGVVPDLLCLGKALGAGFPLSACVGPARVMDAWPPSGGEALHTSTFLGHPVACAAGLAFLDRLEERGLVERAAELGADLLARLADRLGGHPGVREVRGRGLFLGVELAGRDGLPAEGAGAAVAVRALRRGVLVLPAGERGQVVEMAPPAVTTPEQAAAAADEVAGAVEAWWDC